MATVKSILDSAWSQRSAQYESVRPHAINRPIEPKTLGLILTSIVLTLLLLTLVVLQNLNGAMAGATNVFDIEPMKVLQN